MLERSLSQQLADRAPLYRQQAQEAGRQVVEQFVTTWLIREQQWKRDPEHRVIVLFPKEPAPQISGRHPPTAEVWTAVRRGS